MNKKKKLKELKMKIGKMKVKLKNYQILVK